MDDEDYHAWVQDTLGVDPQSFATPEAPPAQAAPADDPPASAPPAEAYDGSAPQDATAAAVSADGDGSGDAATDGGESRPDDAAPATADSGAPADAGPDGQGTGDPSAGAGWDQPDDQGPTLVADDGGSGDAPSGGQDTPAGSDAGAGAGLFGSATDALAGSGDDSVPLDTGGDGGSPDETPAMNPTSPVPTSITADTAVEFVDKANQARGGSEVGHMAPSISYNPTFDDNDKITRVNMVVDTSIVRPRWSGGRPNDVNRAAIKQAEALIKAHEERHRDIARDYATRAVKAMRGKTSDAAKKAFDDAMKQMGTAQAALDKAEGNIIVKESNGGATVDVSLGPAP